MEKIINAKCSIARFGDGEFNLMRGESLGFQKQHTTLTKQLHNVLVSKVSKFEIGLPDIFGDLSSYEVKSARFWKSYMGMHRGEIMNMIDVKRTYLNTNMTRFWTGYRDKGQVKQIISLYKKEDMAR